MIGVQLAQGRGPVFDALAHRVPVISLDVLGDDRWPGLGERILDGVAVEDVTGWQVAGMAAVPAAWGEDGTVVLRPRCRRASAAAVSGNGL